MSEKEFTAMVLALAKLRGWRTAHFRPGMSSKGRWMTAVAGDGVGWPDIFAARDDRAIAAELKVGKNKLSQEQVVWMDTLRKTPVEVYTWRPDDWPLIELVLE